MTNLRIAELDFDQIKQNLKEFLQNQDEFTDYDFEGSGLSVLLDILAYNTHYNAYLANMLVNESFLDSAVKRNSAVSIAKHLGYTPASARGARAIVDITVNGVSGTPQTLTLDRYTPFTTTINGVAYTFLNINEATTTPSNGSYIFSDVTIVEGRFNQQSYVSVQPGPAEKFEITETNIDISTLLVTVQNSATDLTTRTFTLSEDITGVDEDSLVYFLQENPFGRYELFFGDGIIGKLLDAGNIISIRYLVSSGSVANVSELITQSFTTTTIGGSSSITISTTSNSTSGADKESITAIKFRAPLVNASKNRAVTAEDYLALITSRFSEAESVSVWGGEDNDPPIYGKVLISLKPFDGFNIPQTTKDQIKNDILNNKKILAIQPEFIDPDFYFVKLTVNADYDPAITTKSSNTLRNIITTSIQNYFASDLQKFNKSFNKAKFTKILLESDEAITGILMNIELQKRFRVVLNTINTFTRNDRIKFLNAITPGSLRSSRFFTTSANALALCTITDIPGVMPPDPNGTGSLIVRNVVTNRVVSSNVGTVNYSTGDVEITGITPNALPNNVTDLRFTASIQESSQNLRAVRNQILVLDTTVSDAAVGREAGLVVNVTAV
jgi:hypothetical protein